MKTGLRYGMLFLVLALIGGCALAQMEVKTASKSLATQTKYLQAEQKLRLLTVGVSEGTYEWVMGITTIITIDFGKQKMHKLGSGLLTEQSITIEESGKTIRRDLWGYYKGGEAFPLYKVELSGGAISNVLSLAPSGNEPKNNVITFESGNLDGNTFLSKEGVRVSVPNDGWLIYGSADPIAVVIYVRKNNSSISGLLYKANQAALDKPYTTLEDLVSSAITNSRARLPQYKLISQETIQVSGMHGIKVTNSWMDKDKEIMQIRVFFPPVNQYLYSLYAYVPRSEMDRYKADIDKIIDSIGFQ